MLFLGLGASALCFVTWNFAVRKLGAVKTSIYIYLVPVITVGTSVLVLKETITSVSYTHLVKGAFIDQPRSMAAQTPTAGDTVSEIQKYKALLDSGVITEEEFTAKKRQLLRI